MDFGIGFISTNIMLPILDFFFGIVHSYGFAIIALTLVIRLGLYPLSAGQIRNMRKMRITQPLMKERQEEIQRRYKDDPAKQQEEMGKLMQEFGNPLAGCLPLLLQMPILFALFATLRGSPFSDINYTVDVQVLPQEQITQIVPQSYATKAQNIYIDEAIHYPISAVLPGGNRLGAGQSAQITLQTSEGKALEQVVTEAEKNTLIPTYSITKGSEHVAVTADGSLAALTPGDATVQVTVPGIAAKTGFLFIKALGQVGVTGENGEINWDILGMIVFFGFSIYLNQELSGAAGGTSNNPQAQQQQTINKITPILFSGMFLFFPLPAGVLMYIVLANVFQTLQTVILMREPLPENLQKLLDQQEKAAQNREALPFEKKGKKKEKTS
ncbi:membrane protein insertase YidC [Synechocystis sp. LKSZ1]|uniref:membrane protein insertase YidC n=1 Tax=Synechocystis sp. LKSZ1 TaxID=3144951 RepID=UPI00336C1E74